MFRYKHEGSDINTNTLHSAWYATENHSVEWFLYIEALSNIDMFFADWALSKVQMHSLAQLCTCQIDDLLLQQLLNLSVTQVSSFD